MDDKWLSLQAFYPVNTGYPVHWGWGGREGCMRSSADCNTSTLVWPWHQIIWFGDMQACNSNNYPLHSWRMAKRDYLLEAAWGFCPSLTRSYITCLDFYSHAVSFTVICWHDLNIFKPAKLFIQKSFWNALDARITNMNQKDGLSPDVSLGLYLTTERRRYE